MIYQRGDVAKWQGKGLQNPDRGFESRRRLSSSHLAQAKPLTAGLTTLKARVGTPRGFFVYQLSVRSKQNLRTYPFSRGQKEARFLSSLPATLPSGDDCSLKSRFGGEKTDFWTAF